MPNVPHPGMTALAVRPAAENTMKPPSSLDLWLKRHGGRLVLVAMTVAALAQAWRMWKHPLVFW